MLSKFIHIFEKEDIYCYYHSLKNLPLYLSHKENSLLNKYLFDGEETCDNQELINLFRENGFLICDVNEDNAFYNKIKSKLPPPAITTAYFILSEDCNMACKYCFLGNAKKYICSNVTMTLEMAKKSFDYFVYQTITCGLDDNVTRQIVFYGGEPLIGFDTLKYFIDLYKEYKNSHKIDFDVEFSIVTNGTLLTNDMAVYFKKNQVSVSLSLDGPNEFANENRVFKNGKHAFNSILNAINILNANSVDFGLSLTLNESTLSIPVETMIMFLLKKNIISVNLNTLLYAEKMGVKKCYHERATKYIIDFWKLAREKGIYEDRIMRKLNAFVNQNFYYADCAAISGCQLVFAPNGQIGICHGNLESKKTFDFSVNKKTNMNRENLLLEWTKYSPIMREECRDCVAIGICGGGCPLNAKFDEEKDQEIDIGFCTHSKKILEFMIWDLYEKIIEE